MGLSVEHEAPLEVIERFPELLLGILRDQFGAKVPHDARVRAVDLTATVTVARELRCDSALLIEPSSGGAATCAVLVESQRGVDPEKWYQWPRYVAELHAQYQCPTFLLVFAVGEQACSVAEWVRRGIPWLRPDGRFVPMVVAPSDVQFAPSLEAALADVPSAMLATILHAQEADGIDRAVHTLQAVHKRYGEDTLMWIYNLIRAMVGDRQLTEIERFIMLQIQREYFPRTAFEREHFERGIREGKAEGKAEGEAKGKAEGEAKGEAKGKVDALCAVLQARGVAVPPALRERWLEPPNLAQIDRLLVLAATSPSPADVLAAAS